MAKLKKENKPFVHLHVHSEKSFKDGYSSFDEIIAKAKENNQPGIAITDHGVMYDAMGFYLKAKKAGIKPIMGCEVYMIPEGKSAQLRKSDDPDEEGKDDTIPYFHLVLLAKDGQGLFNLHKLCSIAGNKEDGHFYYRPRLFRKDLEEYFEGLICLSACFTPGTKVETKKGIKNIEDIKKGEYVLTHNNTYKEVEYPTQRKYKGTMYELHSSGCADIINCTDNHKFYVLKANDYYSNAKKFLVKEKINKKYYKSLTKSKRCNYLKNFCADYKANWVEAKDLYCDDFLLTPIVENIVDVNYIHYKNRKIKLDSDLLTLFGLYLAEGYKTNWGKSLALTFHNYETDLHNFVVRTFKKKFNIDCVINDRDYSLATDIITENDLDLVDLFEYYCGSRSDKKFIHECFKLLPYDKQMFVIKGLFLGDGSVRSRYNYNLGNNSKTCHINYGTVSRQLINDVIFILNRNNVNPSFSKIGAGVRCGYNHKESYYVDIYGPVAESLSKFIFCGFDEIKFEYDIYNTKEFRHIPVLVNGKKYMKNKITDIFYYEDDLTVYCLNVKNDHSFVANNVVVHNCLGGEIPKLITSKQIKEAKKVAGWYKEIFGDDYYLELQDHGIKTQKLVNKEMLLIAEELDIKTILTNDAHYDKKESYERHKLLKCISYKEKFDNPVNYNKYFPNDNFYIKNNEEMYKVAEDNDCVEAYENTYEIFEKINLEVDTSLHFPKADLSHPVKKGKKFKTASAKLKWLTKELKPEKYDDDYKFGLDAVDGRIEKELVDIARGQFPDYFLNVYDIIKYAKDNKILIGAGRGSGAGSVVANILNITDVDPIEFELIWERFWNPGRCVFAEDGVTILSASPPDIDIDVPSNRRDEVFEFTKRHFGYDRVANIITFGTYKGRNIVRDGAVALDFDEDLTNMILKAMPYKGTPSLSECFDNVDACIDLYNSNKKIARFVDRLRTIEGCSTNASSHPAGVVITDDVMYKYFPVFEGKNGLTSQYPYETLEAVGCLKIDLLGHTAEQVIDDACMLIEERHGIKINPYKIPNDDEKTYQLLRDIRMTGVPQLQADWVIPIIQDVQPSNIEDVIALVTMIRPGSLDSGQTDKYREACKGIPVKADVEELEPVVAKYNNCLLYQEQIMELAKLLGGFTLEEADELRKVCAKTKYADQAEAMLKKLDSGMVNQKISKDHRAKIIEIVKAFFGYSFNKAHAAGYGITTYRVAYLKANYFLELTVAQLNSVIGNHEKTAEFIDEVYYMGYDVFPPDINKSSGVWTCDDNGIYMPLAAISGVGPACVDTIVEERELKGEFKNFEDFVSRTPGKSVKKNVIESFICVGAFNSMGYNVKSLWEQYSDVVDNVRAEKKTGKALFGESKSNTTIKIIKETPKDIEDKKVDEENLLGFVITMTDDEKRLMVKRISKRYEKLKGQGSENGNKKKNHVRGSKRDAEPVESENSNNKKKKSALEKLREKKAKLEEANTEDDKVAVDDIKNNLKSKLKMTKVKKEDPIVENNDYEKRLTIVIKNYNVLPERIFKTLNKYKADVNSENIYDLVFRMLTKDGSTLFVYTDFKVDVNDKLIARLNKIVGEEGFIELKVFE